MRRTSDSFSAVHTYLLTWNPKRWKWPNLESDVAALVCGRAASENRWSTGNTRSIEPGDRLFLLKLGVEPRGIMGSGFAETRPTEEPHWDEERRSTGAMALRVRVRFDRLVTPDAVIPIDLLKQSGLSAMNWSPQARGISVPDELAPLLEDVWSKHFPRPDDASSPDELAPGTSFIEGAARVVVVNRYERDPEARDACVKRWGTDCTVCGFSFEAAYGERGRGFIHVHHLNPLARAGGSVSVDPERDLRPVCANCHAMLHRKGDLIAPERLKELLRTSRTDAR